MGYFTKKHPKSFLILIALIDAMLLVEVVQAWGEWDLLRDIGRVLRASGSPVHDVIVNLPTPTTYQCLFSFTLIAFAALLVGTFLKHRQGSLALLVLNALMTFCLLIASSVLVGVERDMILEAYAQPQGTPPALNLGYSFILTMVLLYTARLVLSVAHLVLVIVGVDKIGPYLHSPLLFDDEEGEPHRQPSDSQSTAAGATDTIEIED